LHPEGNTLYVMRKAVNSNYVQVWNPQTAECFVFQNQQVFKRLFCFTVSSGFQNLNDVDDEACPLKQIFCVFDQHNVYVNIQQSDSPSEISFNIEDQNLWEPFLTQDQLTTFYPKGQVSIQSEIQFDPADPERAKLVQEQLERFIEDSIQDYRKSKIDKLNGPFTTMFSKQRYAQMSSYIRDIILQNLEGFKYRIRQSGMAKMQGVNGEQNEEQVQLNQDQDNEVVWDYQESLKYIYQQQQELMKKKQQYKISKQIYGFPLNFTFIDNEKAWDEVKATGIADITSDELEFLCIVKCFPYPHYIISTWVFVAVLYQQ
ncbi:hypothetical protein pb186bvf_008800, partial [Paramecium bursaria]